MKNPYRVFCSIARRASHLEHLYLVVLFPVLISVSKRHTICDSKIVLLAVQRSPSLVTAWSVFDSVLSLEKADFVNNPDSRQTLQ